jgi:hypothetical protein
MTSAAGGLEKGNSYTIKLDQQSQIFEKSNQGLTMKNVKCKITRGGDTELTRHVYL